MPNPDCEKFCPLVKTCQARTALLRNYSLQIGAQALASSESAERLEGPKQAELVQKDALNVMQFIDDEIEEIDFYKNSVMGAAAKACRGPRQAKRFTFFGATVYKCASESCLLYRD
jgi:hypothetical protein